MDFSHFDVMLFIEKCFESVIKRSILSIIIIMKNRSRTLIPKSNLWPLFSCHKLNMAVFHLHCGFLIDHRIESHQKWIKIGNVYREKNLRFSYIFQLFFFHPFSLSFSVCALWIMSFPKSLCSWLPFLFLVFTLHNNCNFITLSFENAVLWH